jgi:hypothetical protein
VDDSFINSAAFRFLRLFLFLSRGNYVSAKLSGFLPIFSIFFKKSTNSAPAEFLPGVEFSNTAIGPSVSCFVRGRYRMLPSDRIAALRVVKNTLQLTPPLFSCSCTLPLLNLLLSAQLPWPPSTPTPPRWSASTSSGIASPPRISPRCLPLPLLPLNIPSRRIARVLK